MNAPFRLDGTVFSRESRDTFAENYPETPHVLGHRLAHNQLLDIDALAALSERLPESSIEYNRGDLPIGIEGKPEGTGLSIGETIRTITKANSWAVLKNIEQDDLYLALLLSLLEEIRPEIEKKTGTIMSPQGFIFISSPNAVTPYHFDPEHNILLQIAGSKTMTQFPAGDPRFAPDEIHESYHAGGARELSWSDDLADGGTEFSISKGQALFVPVMAPHFVRNGPTSSISLSITWRSDWSFAEADARGFNRLMRQRGFKPAAPGRWPDNNLAKAYSYRAMRKLGLTR